MAAHITRAQRPYLTTTMRGIEAAADWVIAWLASSLLGPPASCRPPSRPRCLLSPTRSPAIVCRLDSQRTGAGAPSRGDALRWPARKTGAHPAIGYRLPSPTALYYHRVMYRYKPHCSIAATLPRALPHAATLPPPGGRTRGRRWILLLGLACVVVAVALAADGAALLPRQAATPAATPVRPSLDKAVVRTVAVGSVPLDIAVDAASGRAFVASRDDSGRGVISTIDAATGQLLRTTTTTSAGLGAVIAIDARRGRAFIANSGMPGQFGAPSGGTISVLDLTR